MIFVIDPAYAKANAVVLVKDNEIFSVTNFIDLGDAFELFKEYQHEYNYLYIEGQYKGVNIQTTINLARASGEIVGVFRAANLELGSRVTVVNPLWLNKLMKEKFIVKPKKGKERDAMIMRLAGQVYKCRTVDEATAVLMAIENVEGMKDKYKLAVVI
jgi:Holliday junction resolvasome RuvABC endonuclease subunit